MFLSYPIFQKDWQLISKEYEVHVETTQSFDGAWVEFNSLSKQLSRCIGPINKLDNLFIPNYYSIPRQNILLECLKYWTNELRLSNALKSMMCAIYHKISKFAPSMNTSKYLHNQNISGASSLDFPDGGARGGDNLLFGRMLPEN